MAKIYTKGTWVDEVLAGDAKYTIKEAGVSTHADAEIALKTEVVTPGTPVNAEKMNNIEDGIDALDTKLNSTGADIIKESSASLTVGSIANGDFLVRSGTTIDGKTVAETQAILNPNSLIGGAWHKQLWIGGWKPTLTNGCLSSAQLETATNKVNVDYTGFVAAATKYGYANVPMPEDYTGGTVYYKVYWKHPTATKYAVQWHLSGVAVGNNETLDVATGTGVEVNDTGGTANRLYISDLSGAVTIAGSPAAGELVYFRVCRAGENANDTLDATARLIGVTIWYPVG